MPQLFFDPLNGLNSFVRQIPVPTLNSYIILSVLLTLGSAYYVHDLFQDNELNEMIAIRIRTIVPERFSAFANFLASSSVFRQIYYSFLNPTSIWVSINTICSITAILGKMLIYVSFGELAHHETTLLRDRLSNWLLYKVLFLFGVLNSTVVEELIAWIIWFAIHTLYAIIQLMAIHKLDYFSASLPSQSLRLRVLTIGIFSLCTSAIAMLMAFYSFTFLPFNYSLFIMADVCKVFLRALYITCKSLLLSQHVNFLMSRRSSVVISYYLDLVYDILIDCVELIHYAHMMLYLQIVLSIAFLALTMQIRTFYKSLSTRIARHFTHQRIVAHIFATYREATADELEDLKDRCAICWEKMDSARRLPCAHYFHEWCLVGWLEQDSSCPTCRLMLPSTYNEDTLANAQHVPVTHFFYFDGARIANWLPSFSFEFTHGGVPRHFPRNERSNGLEIAQLSTMAEQIQEMFPQVDFISIRNDLRISGSLQATVDNILEGRIAMDQANVHLNTDNDTEGSSQLWELSDDRSSLPDDELDWTTASTSSATTATRHHRSTASGFASRSNENSTDQQTILSRNRQILIEKNRRRYIASPRGADLRKVNKGNNSETFAEMSDG